jgi:integrase
MEVDGPVALCAACTLPAAICVDRVAEGFRGGPASTRRHDQATFGFAHIKGQAVQERRQFQIGWTRLMDETHAGKIRQEGFTFHGLRASSVEKLREVGCGDRDIEAITGMSTSMVTRYSRFADQRRLARAAVRRLEGRTAREQSE